MILLYARTFTAAVVFDDGSKTVTRAADIVRYMMGWDRRRVLGYARKRHWITHERE